MSADDFVPFDLDAGQEAILVPWHAIERFHDADDARRALGAELDAPQDDAVDDIAARLASGRFVLVRVRARSTAQTDRRAGETTSTGDDWSRAPMLSDLAPRVPPPPSPRRTPEPASIPIDTDASLVPALDERRARLVELGGPMFASDHEMLLFGVLRDATEGDGPITVRGALRTLLLEAAQPGRRLLVAGHADALGSKADNAALSERRARNVELYLRGDRAGWAQHAFDNDSVRDLQAALAWAAISHGIDCDPGAIDGDLGAQTVAALASFREHDAREPYGPVTPDDWGALFDLYDLDLARLLFATPAELSALRAGLSWCDPGAIGCGERAPLASFATSGCAGSIDRRVDVLVFEDADAPRFDRDPADQEIYGGDYCIERIAVPAEQALYLRVVDELGAPMANASVRLQTPDGRVLAKSADADGRVTVLALRGDRFESSFATDEDEDWSLVDVRTGS